MKKHMVFIPELKTALTNQLMTHGSPAVVSEAFKRWESNDPPRTPFERGAFEVFRKVQSDIEART